MKCMTSTGRLLATLLAGITVVSGLRPAHASDHLDTPTVAMNPRADIGDLYAWTSADGKQLNLVMTLVGQSFSDVVEYAFHIDSGKTMGVTTNTTTIRCKFSDDQQAACRVDGAERPLRVFAGQRDDPFFNNVRGTRAAYQRAAAALKGGVATDVAGCPSFDAATTNAILSEWRHTDGGDARDFLAGWSPASLVVSIDLDLVTQGRGDAGRLGRDVIARRSARSHGSSADRQCAARHARFGRSERQAEGGLQPRDSRDSSSLRAGDGEDARPLRRLRRQVRQSAARRQGRECRAVIVSSRRCSPTIGCGSTARRRFARTSLPWSWRS